MRRPFPTITPEDPEPTRALLLATVMPVIPAASHTSETDTSLLSHESLIVSCPPLLPLHVAVDRQAEDVTEVPRKSNVFVRTMTLAVLSDR